MTPLRPVGLAELAALAGRSYDWAQKNAHRLPIDPVPGLRAAFTRASVLAWLGGDPRPAQAPASIRQTAQPEAPKTAANDTGDEDFSPPETAALRAFGL